MGKNFVIFAWVISNMGEKKTLYMFIEIQSSFFPRPISHPCFPKAVSIMILLYFFWIYFFIYQWVSVSLAYPDVCEQDPKPQEGLEAEHFHKEPSQ